MKKIIFTKNEMDLLKKGETVWKCLNYKLIDDKIKDMDNDHFVDNYEVIDTSLENVKFKKQQVLQMLIALTENYSLRIKKTYIDLGSNWIEETIVDDECQWLSPNDATLFAQDNFTLELVLKYAQKIKDSIMTDIDSKKKCMSRSEVYKQTNELFKHCEDQAMTVLDLGLMHSIEFFDKEKKLDNYAISYLANICWTALSKADYEISNDKIADVVLTMYFEYCDNQKLNVKDPASLNSFDYTTYSTDVLNKLD